MLNSWLITFIDMTWITHTSQHISQVTQLRRLCFPSKMIFICHYLRVKLLPWYFWNLSAAFDTIDHSTLLSCLLDWFGVGGSALKWFSSYFTERYRSVKIGSTLSDLQKLLFSVPQGSVLGPLLFSLYTSPLSTLIDKHKGVNFHFYAEDTQLYVHLSHMNASAAFDKLNRCLQDVKEWMSASKLKLNPDKTEFILFGSKKQRERLNACFPIDILGSPLHPTESVRNLGVWFD